MSMLATASLVVHLLVAAVWVGAVAFVTVAVLPLGRRGELDAAPFSAMVDRLQTVTRASALVVLATGLHLAWVDYSVAALAEETAGWLVLAMAVLWLALTGLLEVGTARMAEGLDERKVRTPARTGAPFLRAATVVGLVLLGIGGLLASP